MENAIVAGLILTPVVIGYLLKSNGAIVFLSVCAGFVLASYGGGGVNYQNFQLDLGKSSNQLILLLIPPVLSLLLTLKTVVKPMHLMVNGVLNLCAGALLAYEGGLLLNDILNIHIQSSPVWGVLDDTHLLIAAVGTILSLIIAWHSRPKHKDKKHKK